jgi:hypothetical protein
MLRDKLKGGIRYVVGLVTDRHGEDIKTQREAWYEDAQCGCGIDCCRGVIVLEDQVTKVPTAIYVLDGVLTAQPYDDFKANGPVIVT